MADDIAIKIEHVSKDFVLPHEKHNSIKSVFTSLLRFPHGKKEKQHALKGIDFEVKQGEFFGIVGRNGSGKSTLLKILAGIYQPTRGDVHIKGKLVPFIELGVGFNPELTGRENVYLNGALLGFSEKEIDFMYDDIVAFAELERFMDQKLKNYSSGMQVRLAFSMATRSEADILLIDEVLAVGDADFQKKCFSYFKQLKREKKTVVFVSHDMNAVREYCDRAILIESSEILFSGSANDTAKEYTRMFMPEVYAHEKRAGQQQQARRGNSRKWGAGGLDIVALKIAKSVFTPDDKEVAVSYAIEAQKGFEDEIIPGITIKDESGSPICGTNTKIIHPDKHYHLGGKQAVLQVSWHVPNIFNAGTFTVEPAILSATTLETLQWWDEAIHFEVINEASTPYPAAPPITAIIED